MVLVGAITLITSATNAQQVCSANEQLQAQVAADASLAEYIRQYLAKLNQWLANYPLHPQLHRSAVSIPVVVHVLHNNATQNVSDARIRAQIEALNQDFRRRNSGISTVPTAFRNISSDAYIQFRLARRKPDGTATDGIVHKSTTQSFFLYNNSEPMKKNSAGGADPWDVTKYLNIWICDLRWQPTGPSGPVFDNLLGYGTFPEDKNSIPGVVMDFTQLGANPAAYVPDRTWTHEMGHFFGLKHIWGDDCFNSTTGQTCFVFPTSCGGSDDVSDTPNQECCHFGCPTGTQITCSNGPNGDMYMNFMDYVDDGCMQMFTRGQAARMLGNLAPGAARASLAVSNALFPANAQDRDFEVFLEAQNSQLPSWKAALVMIHAWACQCSPAVDQLVAQNASQSSRHISGLPNDMSEVIHALALTPEEMLMSYSIEGFYNLLSQGPITLLSIANNEYYGLVISGMVMDSTTGTARLKIKDPMNVGPSFSIDQTGSEYTVDYQEFMIENLEELVRDGKRVFIVYPPHRN